MMSHLENCIEEIKFNYVVVGFLAISPVWWGIEESAAAIREEGMGAGLTYSMAICPNVLFVGAITLPLGFVASGLITASVPFRLSYSYLKDLMLSSQHEENSEDVVGQLCSLIYPSAYRPSLSGNNRSSHEHHRSDNAEYLRTSQLPPAKAGGLQGTFW